MRKLREADSPYRAVFEAARDAMIVYTPDGVVVEVNAAACATYGYAREEMIGLDARQAVHPDARPLFEQFLRVVGAGGEFHCETVDRRRDGTTFPIEVTGTHFTHAGQPRLMSVVRDITERRRAEEQLRRNHDTFYNLIQNNPFGVYVVDADFRLRQVSLGSRKVFQNVLPLLGRDFAEVLRTVWPEPFASEATARFRQTLDTGEPYAAMRTVERRQDVPEVEAYDWRIERVMLPDGRFGVVCYFYDLTQRQQLEAELAFARRRIDTALIAGEVGTFLWDVTTDRVWGDENFSRIFGVTPDADGAAPRAAYRAAIHPDDRARVSEKVRRAVDTGCDYEAEYRVVTPARTRWVIARGKVEQETGRVARFAGIVLDVTERKQAELLLAAQGRALELLATGAPLAEALGALTGAVEEQSGGQAVASILVVGPDGCSLYTGAAPTLPPEYNAAIDGIKAAKGVGTCADAAARNEVVCTPDLAAAESWRGLSHLPLALGLKAAWSMPIRAHDGRVLGTFGTYFRECREPTERERLVVAGLCRVAALAIERRRAEDGLREARDASEAANRAKDKFLAVLSHELRTPLSPVVMTIPAMELDPEMPFKFREDLAMVRRNIELEVKLIDDLLDLSRVTSGKLRLHVQPLRVHELLDHVVRSIAGETAAKGLRVRLEARAANDLLAGDPARLQQVFWNLLRNAVKFTPEGGEITVSTWNRDEDGRLMVEVKDTGVGIATEVLPRVFDAFEQGDVRMTRQFGGLGLGLAIAKAVVEMHGGAVSAASDGPGHGATFTVELAVTQGGADARARPAAAPSSGARQAQSRVLLVEDHPDTSRAMASLLTRSGYEVKSAHSVASALQLAAAEPFDIVVSDIGLPDATGYELMEQIRDRFGIRGIALSGYGMEEDMRKSREAGFVEHVIKPVNVVQLQAVIERVLGDVPG